jgi:hypothetical protein
MIIENDQDYVKITLLFERPTNVFQDEMLVEVLEKLSTIDREYEENYQEYV